MGTLFFNQNSLYRLHVERFVREDALQIHNQTRVGVFGDVDDFPFQDVQLRVENDVRQIFRANIHRYGVHSIYIERTSLKGQ